MSDSLQPLDCSPPGSSVHGIFQARMLEWSGVPLPLPGDLPDLGIAPMSPTLLFTTEPLSKFIFIKQCLVDS